MLLTAQYGKNSNIFLRQMWQMIFRQNRNNFGYASVFFSLLVHFFLIRLFITSSFLHCNNLNDNSAHAGLGKQQKGVFSCIFIFSSVKFLFPNLQVICSLLPQGMADKENGDDMHEDEPLILVLSSCKTEFPSWILIKQLILG